MGIPDDRFETLIHPSAEIADSSILAPGCVIYPFVYIGAYFAGAAGVLAGQAIGSVVTGIAALWVSFYMVRKVSGDDGPVPGPGKNPFNLRIPIWPQTNTRG